MTKGRVVMIRSQIAGGWERRSLHYASVGMRLSGRSGFQQPV
jgi:hypothetical protein